jgi:protein-tyrosine phosphatase
VRHIPFESVPNFRDLGGYRTHDGRTVAWRRLFRSAALHTINDRDMARLKGEIGLRAVIDLRSPKDARKDVRLLEAIGARYPCSSRTDYSVGLTAGGCQLPFRIEGSDSRGQ